MLDTACDQMGKRFLSDRLPPAFTDEEAAGTCNKLPSYKIQPNTMCRLAREGIARMVLEEEEENDNGSAVHDGGHVIMKHHKTNKTTTGTTRKKKAVLYHCVDNSREYHEIPLSPLEFEIDDAPAIEMLLTTIAPNWICVNDIIHDDIEDKIDVTQTLFDEGLLSVVIDDKIFSVDKKKARKLN